MRVLPPLLPLQAQPQLLLAALLLSPPPSLTTVQKAGPPRELIHSLLYCISPTRDSLWTGRSYHSSGMSAGFSGPASFAFIYLAAFFCSHKDCVFGVRPYRDASRNVSQKEVFFQVAEGPGRQKDFCTPTSS